MLAQNIVHGITRLSVAAALAAFAGIALSTPALQAQEEEVDERAEELQQRVEETRERLQLTDEQIDLLVPLLQESFEGTRAVLEEHGIDLGAGRESGRRLNIRQARSLRGDLDEVQEELYEKIEEAGFLSDEQFEEFKKIQEEQREAMRERIRARRDR